MRALSVETSTDFCSIALLNNDEVYVKEQLLPRAHTEVALHWIDELLALAKIELTQLDCLVVGLGPGSFMGGRLAASLIQGLALGANLPVIGVSSLQALAQGQYRLHGLNEANVAIDARMQEIYSGHYKLNPVTKIMEPVTPDCKIKASDPVDSLPYPSAQDLFPAATFALQNKQFLPLDQILPTYLRSAI